MEAKYTATLAPLSADPIELPAVRPRLDHQQFSQELQWLAALGPRLDVVSGLYYFRMRMMSATLGRFVSRDPLRYVDGASLYRAYFVPEGIDPSGYRTLTLDDAEEFAQNLKWR